MPLLELWTSSPDAIGKSSIEQIVAIAGDGALKDGTFCSEELRSYLSQVPSDKLFDRLEYREEVTSHVVEIGSEIDEVVTGPTARDRIAARCGARGRQVGPVQADRAKWYVESNGQVGARAAESGKCSA